MQDIYNQQQSEDSANKYNHLQGKYIMRFPFTVTALKWGFTLGTFIGVHSYIKKSIVTIRLSIGRPNDAVIAFVSGSIFSGMAIWGFFMFKYSFYSFTLRKFEQEQFGQIEQSQIFKNYMKKQILKQDINDDDTLVQKIQEKQQQIYRKHSKLDNLLREDLIKQLEQQMFGNNSL